jgi:hypothetical protein
MPRPKTYPLKGLLKHRDRRVEGATAELGAAVRTREAADEERATLERAQKAAKERVQREREVENRRLVDGELRVTDLALADAWELGVRQEADALEAARHRADAEAQAAFSREATARAALAHRKGERDVVTQEERRFAERLRRATDAAEEEDAAEAWQGKRGDE